MTQKSTQSRAGLRYASVRPSCIGLCVLAVTFAGCAAQRQPRAKTFPWATVKSVRPVMPKTAESYLDVSTDDSLAELDLAVPPPPSLLVEIESVPQRPRVVVVPSSGPTNSSRPEPPQIAPQLTAAETAAAQQQMNLSLSVVERNIAAAHGKNLNAMQSDLASKVRSFVTEAREAAHVGDWTRASNAAKKAQVLSEELVGSL